LGLLWQKLWHGNPRPNRPNETPKKKPVREPNASCPLKPFELKRIYRWVEALKAVDKQFKQVESTSEKSKQLEEIDEAVEAIDQKTRIIHIFDREGDIAEVFDQVRQIEHIGVRAAHDRSLDPDNSPLCEHLSTQPIQFYHR